MGKLSKKYCDELNGILPQVRIGLTIDYLGVHLAPSLSRHGCTGCVFETEKGAIDCQFRFSCMAHLRNDRKSVIFSSPK